MTKLDINTPKGQQSLQDEMVAASIFMQHQPGYWYIHTDKESKADVDGIIFRYFDHKLTGVAETKCRYDMDLSKFREVWRSEWLVTRDKIVRAQQVAGSLQTILYGFLYIVPSRTLLVRRLWHPDNGWVSKIHSKVTRTQATINGGSAVRNNAFIDMSQATVMVDIDL